MSFEKLKPELWDHVLYFLTPALPKPLSGWTKSEAVGEIAKVIDRLPEDGAPGTVGRKDIRAQGLTVLMRTSIVSPISGYKIETILGLTRSRLSIIMLHDPSMVVMSYQTIYPNLSIWKRHLPLIALSASSHPKPRI